MYNINHAIGLAMSFFTVAIVVTDTHWQHDKTSGQDKQSILATRNLNVPVDPNNSKQMQSIFGGSVSDGDIIVNRTRIFQLYLFVIGSGHNVQCITRC